MGFICKIAGHKWNGCKCLRCGQERNEEHSWQRENVCVERCSVCGRIRGQHSWDGCICRRCGETREYHHPAYDISILSPELENGIVTAHCVKCKREVWKKKYRDLVEAVESSQEGAIRNGCEFDSYYSWKKWFRENPDN